MSHQITLSFWSGASKSEAAKKLAKVFHLQLEKSLNIVDQLCQSLPWRFDRGIPDHQADTAFTYLSSLGFVVDIQPIEGKIKALSGAVFMAEAPEKEKVPVLEDSYRFNFCGDGRTLLKISFTNLIKMVFSIGIYRFWAKTNFRQYIWSQTVFMGDPFSYNGTGKELLNDAFQWGGVIVLLGLINIYIMFNIGLEESQKFFELLCFIVVIMLPVFLVGVWKYKISRTTWRNIPFSFRGKKMDAFTLYLFGGIISTVTLGLYWPFFKIKSERFWREQLWLGNEQFRFSGVSKEFFKKFIIAALLTPLTLGFYFFWFIADLKRYLWSHTHVFGATFHFSIKGQDYMKLKLANFFILLFTLGMGFPWTVVRNQKFLTENLVLLGNLELNHIVHEKIVSEAFEKGTLHR